MSSLLSKKSGALEGVPHIPGDKSISHRGVIFGSIALGRTEISHLLEGQDVVATINAFRAMGVEIQSHGGDEVTIEGAGGGGLERSAEAMDLGNSGTSMRLLCGLLAGQRFDSTLIGDQSLSGRPMKRVIDPLTMMGAEIDSNEYKAPLVIHGARALKGIDYVLPMASAQVKSAVMLAGLRASGVTTVIEPTATRDHTERMLAAFASTDWRQGQSIRVSGDYVLKGQCFTVPGDISSAAFFIVAALLNPGSDLFIPNVGLNPTRSAVLDILAMMGAQIETVNIRTEALEPVCDLRVKYSELQGVDIPEKFVANAIDEFPILAVAAAAASGVTRVRGASELRVKESDRISAMVGGLQSLGIDATEVPDGMDIVGGKILGGRVESYGDHRVAMAFAIAGSIAEGEIEISESQNVATSFPNFVAEASGIGLSIQEQ